MVVMNTLMYCKVVIKITIVLNDNASALQGWANISSYPKWLLVRK
jgi:hypothetical protein